MNTLSIIIILLVVIFVMAGVCVIIKNLINFRKKNITDFYKHREERNNRYLSKVNGK